MNIAPGILLVTLAIAIGAALLAGLYPAWRAARSQPAIAMREE
jgi:putative ABC transport system permease protein